MRLHIGYSLKEKNPSIHNFMFINSPAIKKALLKKSVFGEQLIDLTLKGYCAIGNTVPKLLQ